jgi:hypothetical protein
MKKFFKGLFLDDVGEPCVGRFSLFIGMFLTVITGVWSIDTIGEITVWEAVVRCSPGLIGLIAYIFTRIAEMKEWIAETAQKVVKAKK